MKKRVKKYQYGGGVTADTFKSTGSGTGGTMADALATMSKIQSSVPQAPISGPNGIANPTSGGSAPSGFMNQILGVGGKMAMPGMSGAGQGIAGAAPRGMGMGPRGMGRSMDGPGMTRGGPRGRPMPKTGGPNPGMRQPLPMPPPGSAIRNIAPMAAQQVMPGGRAFKKGGMVGCDWSPKSSKTMRGAARKGK